MRPLFFWPERKVLPIPNTTAKENFKVLTGVNLKKEVKNALLCSAALENASMIEPGGRSIVPAISTVVILFTPQPVLWKTHSTMNLS